MYPLLKTINYRAGFLHYTFGETNDRGRLAMNRADYEQFQLPELRPTFDEEEPADEVEVKKFVCIFYTVIKRNTMKEFDLFFFCCKNYIYFFICMTLCIRFLF